MGASAAGLVRVNAILLTVVPSTASFAGPTLAYGAIGVNDSGLSLVEARDYKNWTFTYIGGGTGYSVSIYGTTDPVAYAQWRASHDPQAYFNRVGGAPVLPPTSWVLLPGPSEQTGTGVVGNPLTSSAPFFQFSGAIVGVRAVLTASAAAAGTATIAVEAIP